MTGLAGSPIGRWLIASLVLNLLLAGFAGGMLMRDWRAADDGKVIEHSERRDTGRPMLRRDRDGPMRMVFRENRDELHELVRETREARHATREALTADPFDADAVRAALAAQRAADAALQAQLHALMVEGAAGLTAEERAALARHMTTRRPMRHRRGGERHAE
jgi:uncharacterized membrane protein